MPGAGQESALTATAKKQEPEQDELERLRELRDELLRVHDECISGSDEGMPAPLWTGLVDMARDTLR
jgi:hypothetical protein